MPITAEEILENISKYGIEFYRTYPGLYRGLVTANNDPLKAGRIKARVPAIHDEAPNVWIKPAMQGAGNGRGMFWPPEVGDTVYVTFAQGNPGRPELYIGGWYGWPENQSRVPSELGYSGSYPDIRGFVTRWGHTLLFSDEDGNERVELIWNKPNAADAARTDTRRTTTAGEGVNTQGGGRASLKFTPDGSIEITDNATPNQTIKMNATAGTIEIADKNGNKVTLGPTGATVEAPQIDLGGQATEFAIKGTSWLRWAATHTHGTSMGPTTPPAVPPTPDLLSTTVKVK